MGADIRPRQAREDAEKALREADCAEAHAWSLRMEGYGGPAEPSPSIGQCLNGGLGWLEVEMQSLQDDPRARPALGRHSPAAPGRTTAGSPLLPSGQPSALQTIAKAQRLLTVRARLTTCDASWLRIGRAGLRGGTSFGRCSLELWLHLRCGQISSSEDIQPPDLGNAAQYPKTLACRNPVS
jgi:hypothetical protein